MPVGTAEPRPGRAERIARELLASLDACRPIAPLSGREPAFDPTLAYEVTAAVRRLREGRGERVVGRKIGFTNRTIWPEYGVHAPIWGYVYDSTVRDGAGRVTLDLRPYLEPRIEPEIVFGLSQAPRPDMDERGLMACVAWVAHGFEIVQSPFPAWRFEAADTVAAFGLHGALVIGPRHPVAASERERWLAALPGFEITLSRDGAAVDRGSAANVLDGPMAALRHLVGLLAADPISPPLDAGEIVSTGTLTRALPVRPGETWTTELHGIDLPGLAIRLV